MRRSLGCGRLLLKTFSALAADGFGNTRGKRFSPELVRTVLESLDVANDNAMDVDGQDGGGGGGIGEAPHWDVERPLAIEAIAQRGLTNGSTPCNSQSFLRGYTMPDHGKRTGAPEIHHDNPTHSALHNAIVGTQPAQVDAGRGTHTAGFHAADQRFVEQHSRSWRDWPCSSAGLVHPTR